MRLINANELKERILKERERIPRTVPAAPYEFVKEKANLHGDAMRGGIRIALRCMEQMPAVDAVEVVRCKYCKHCAVCGNGLHVCKAHDLHLLRTTPDGYCFRGKRRESSDE